MRYGDVKIRFNWSFRWISSAYPILFAVAFNRLNYSNIIQHFSDSANIRRISRRLLSHRALNYQTIRTENEMPASVPLSNLNLTLVPSFSYYHTNCASAALHVTTSCKVCKLYDDIIIKFCCCVGSFWSWCTLAPHIKFLRKFSLSCS